MRSGGLVMFLLLGCGATLAHAAGNPAAGEALAGECVACHGQAGHSAAGMYPHLAGQNAAYLATQLRAYRDGQREGPVMKPFAEGLSDQQIQDLAAYYAAQEPPQGATPEQYVEPGARLYRAGDAQAGVPACMACHGPAGKGNLLAGWPALAGQQEEYVRTQLEAYAAGERQTDSNGMMRDIAARLRKADIEAVSHYVSGLH
jgi:cytochrome c553